MTRTRTAVILSTSGAHRVEPSFPVDDLARLQAVVGGYIEVVRVHPIAVDQVERTFGIALGDAARVFLVVNEEGKLDGLPYNAAASAVVGDVIVGDALVVELPPDDVDQDDDE